MPSESPLQHSPFSKGKSSQDPLYPSSNTTPFATTEGTSSNQRTQSSLAVGNTSSKDPSEDFEEIQAETPPRKAIFTFGNDSLDNFEASQTSSLGIPSKTKGDLKSKVSWDPAGSPLQNLFVPPEEQKRSDGATLPPKATLHNPPLERKNRNLSRSSFCSQNGQERQEDTNQLTAQTMMTDFIAPLRSTVKPIWARRDDEKTPSPSPSWFVRVVRFFKRGRKELPLSCFKRIVKSSFAFFLASLIVIIAPVQKEIGPYAYMAPFITILFDSTRTSGAQLEIAFLTCGFLTFGLLYYLMAFGLFAVYNRSFASTTKEEGLISDGAFIIALFFFLAMFILGWLRASFAKLSSPAILLSFFLAITMTKVPIEGTEVPYHQFGIALAPALIGLLISLVVNLILWPESASQDLGKSLELTLQHSHRSLKFLTSCFLLDQDSQFVRVEDLEELHTRSMDAATALVKAGREARYEYTYSVHPPTDYKDMIDTILSLQQQMGGFNLAVQREYQLLNLSKPKGDKGVSPLSSRSGSPTELKALSLPPSPSAMSLNKLAEEMMPVTPDIDPLLARSLIHDIIHFVKDPLVLLTDISLVAIHAALKLLAEENELDFKIPTDPTPADPVDKPSCQCAAPADTSCSHTLPENPEDPWASMDLSTIAPQLRAAIIDFEVAEGRCLHLIHQQILFTPHLHTPFPEPMLVVFSGIFSVREFAKELLKLLEEIERFQALRPSKGKAKKSKSKRLWRPRVGLSRWLQGHRTSEEPHQAEFYASEETSTPVEQLKRENHEAREDIGMDTNPEDPLILPNQRWAKPEYSRSTAFRPDHPNTFWFRMRQRLWRFSKHMSSYEVRFGLKLTLAMVILTFPAYVPAFSQLYAEINGPWGAIAAMFIINQTIGGTLYLGVVRLAGTIIGATWGYLTCLANINVGNIYLVIVMIWMFNAPAWYAIITTSYSRIGFNGLTTFCAVFFVNYSTQDSGAILRLALIRALSVVVGLVVSMVIASTLWPYVARNEVRKVVAGLMSDMGANFGKVAALCMTQHGSIDRANLDEQVRCQQHQLQKRLLAANTLLLFANREPRLKGPFASEVYQEQLRVLQDILDQLVAMRGAVLQIGPEVQATVIIPFNAYHKFMVSSVILYFYVLSGALRAKHPLPPYPPPIHAIRHKLMVKTRAAMVRKYQKSHARSGARRNFSTPFISAPHLSVIKQDFNHIYWYSYMAGLVRLFEDVELLGHNVAELVGESTFPSADVFQGS
ncbi:hypothetical protein DSO57_1015181 [Entomophthora muscae]|uniref:Uncharacterized protein n=1 Tax=Entomophthora muscae TaxID=34485 RepID=A0ACC2RJT1_9FUNG|nr:hypothetical protein DSO57_1015181 [Entomophthora muscae]